MGESDEEEKDRKGKNKAQELDEEDYSEVRQRKGKAREVYEEMEVDTVMGEEATKELPSQRVKPPSAGTIRIKPLATRVEESMQVDEDPEVKQEVPTTCTPCATRNLQCVLLIGHYACAFCSHRKLKCDRVPQRWRRVSKKERIEINSLEVATTRRATARKRSRSRATDKEMDKDKAPEPPAPSQLKTKGRATSAKPRAPRRSRSKATDAVEAATPDAKRSRMELTAPPIRKTVSAPSEMDNRSSHPSGVTSPPNPSAAMDISVPDLGQVPSQYVYFVEKEETGKLNMMEEVRMAIEEGSRDLSGQAGGVKTEQLERLVQQLLESNQKWEERNMKWEESYRELQGSYRQVEETVRRMEESNKKIQDSHCRMEESMKAISEEFHQLQNTVGYMVSSQNGHTATLESHRQSLQQIHRLVHDTGIKYIPPPSLPRSSSPPRNPDMFPGEWNMGTPMTTSVMDRFVNPSMLAIASSPAFTTQVHSAWAQSEASSMEAGPSGTSHDSDTNDVL